MKEKLTIVDVGKERTITKFLWFPKRIDGKLIWLKKVRINQRVHEIDVGNTCEYGVYEYKWVNKSFFIIGDE